MRKICITEHTIELRGRRLTIPVGTVVNLMQNGVVKHSYGAVNYYFNTFLNFSKWEITDRAEDMTGVEVR